MRKQDANAFAIDGYKIPRQVQPVAFGRTEVRKRVLDARDRTRARRVDRLQHGAGNAHGFPNNGQSGVPLQRRWRNYQHLHARPLRVCRRQISTPRLGGSLPQLPGARRIANSNRSRFGMAFAERKVSGLAGQDCRRRIRASTPDIRAEAMTSAHRYDGAALEMRRPGPSRAEGVLDPRELVRLAVLAASSHNTQPWKFAIRRDAITILPDFSRRCPVEEGLLRTNDQCAAVEHDGKHLLKGRHAPAGEGALLGMSTSCCSLLRRTSRRRSARWRGSAIGRLFLSPRSTLRIWRSALRGFGTRG